MKKIVLEGDRISMSQVKALESLGYTVYIKCTSKKTYPKLTLVSK